MFAGGLDMFGSASDEPAEANPAEAEGANAGLEIRWGISSSKPQKPFYSFKIGLLTILRYLYDAARKLL